MADYAKTTWVDETGVGDGTLFTAERLNNIESGVEDAAQHHKRGPVASRPAAAAGNKNWLWIDDDTGALSYSDGAAWHAVGGSGGGGAPSGPAGGVLSGTYPDPGFAEDMATQAELDAAIATRQAADGELSAIAGLTSAANKFPYFTGSQAAALADLTAFARTLLDDADAATARGTLGLGTAATFNVPATGDAASGEVVRGSDSRLTNARTPTAHNHPQSEITDLVTDLAAKTAESTRSASGMGVVEHGATAGTARPSGWHRITWVGSVQPSNAVNGDLWVDTS